MKRMLGVLAVVVAAVAFAPRSASAQCDGVCFELYSETGTVIARGCATGGQDKCWATTSRCIMQPCGMALHSDSDGRMLAATDGCGGKPATLVALKAAPPKPARDRPVPVEEAPSLAIVEKPSPPKRGE